MEGVWSAEDTTPSEIEAGIRRLLGERHAQDADYVPARVLNLIVVVDREWRGEIENRLARIGRFHPSRSIVCAVEPGRTTLDAWATIQTSDESRRDAFALSHEHIELAVGPRHLPHLNTICDPLVITDLPTVVWAPHGHAEALDSLIALAQVALIDSVEAFDPGEGLGRARELADDAYIVDLAWLRSTPWRERICSIFDPPHDRPLLREIAAVRVRHHPGSGAAALLLVGWLASRLGWRPNALVEHGGVRHGRIGARRLDVEIDLEPAQLEVPGLVGLDVETASGASISLDRGPGGLIERRRERDGRERAWTVLGASRGESGILGEGVRQALLRDPTYAPALKAACALVG